MEIAIPYSVLDVEQGFDHQTYHRGFAYYQEGRVVVLEAEYGVVDEHSLTVVGSVYGSGRNHYQLSVTIEPKSIDNPDSALQFLCFCTCPVEQNCKHAVALLLKLIDENNDQTQDIVEVGHSYYDEVQSWTQCQHHDGPEDQFKLNRSSGWWYQIQSQYQESRTLESDQHALLYILGMEDQATCRMCYLNPVISKKLKKGGYGKPQAYKSGQMKSKQAATIEDKALMAFAASVACETYSRHDIPLYLSPSDDLLKRLVETQRCFWSEISEPPLQLAKKRKLSHSWVFDKEGRQFFSVQIDGEPVGSRYTVLPLSPLWYFDAQTHALGKLDYILSEQVILAYMHLRHIAPADVSPVCDKLKAIFEHESVLPLPERLDTKIAGHQMQPKVRLLIGEQQVAIDHVQPRQRRWRPGRHLEVPKEALACVTIQYDYAEKTVGLVTAEQSFFTYHDGKLSKIIRDPQAEKKAVNLFTDHDIKPLAAYTQYADDPSARDSFLLGKMDEPEAVFEAIDRIKTLANEKGWSICYENGFALNVVDAPEDWYVDIDDSHGIDWFSLALGFVIDGEKVNLLPLLVDFIQKRIKQLSLDAVNALADDMRCPLALEDGRTLMVPFKRIKPMLELFCELFDEHALHDDGTLPLSRFQAALLKEIESAVNATNLRWFGGEKLQVLAAKLANFKSIVPVTLTKKWKTMLRPYQQEGVHWLQFLRAYDLGGILADDMGLGKTIQTLAHLSIEKSKKRLKKPCLLVAPTSLTQNWLAEAKRFAPALSTLLIHGANRKQHYAKIQDYDLVVTTYPLIIRDKKIWLEHDFYYVILDEAQNIKNAKAKGTQILLQLKTELRLCLTGTPMENHLGELWSLFHFIVPGLLGTAAQFKHIFRTPIEKNQDHMRHMQLLKRIKPFMLRRKKDDVAFDLPKKTMMIRKVEITGPQRDLYESIRLSMEKRVQDAMRQKGLGRSHITILDALLKLRQVCCAPQLLKLEQARHNILSAKLEDLRHFLPTLIEEGRRILLFSSFTSMLALIEAMLVKEGIFYVKLTGASKDRKTPIERFQSGEVPLFLISLKAGGVGLNLTAADTVIHFDPWWNPAAEQQATDRAHRIGQTKPIFVYKLIAQDTVEEKIITMQNKKQQLIEGVIEQGAQKSLQLSASEISALFEPMV